MILNRETALKRKTGEEGKGKKERKKTSSNMLLLFKERNGSKCMRLVFQTMHPEVLRSLIILLERSLLRNQMHLLNHAHQVTEQSVKTLFI